MRMKGRKKTQTPNDGVGDSSGLFSRVSRLMIQCSSMDWFHAESLGFKFVNGSYYLIIHGILSGRPVTPGNGCGQCSSTATALGSGSLCNGQGTEEGGQGAHSKKTRKSPDMSTEIIFLGHAFVKVFMLIHLIDPKFAYWHGKVQLNNMFTSSSPTSRASDEINSWYVVQKWLTSVSSPWV